MKFEKFKQTLVGTAETLIAAENYLSSIDAETGDGDHGVTIAKIAHEIKRIAQTETKPEDTLKGFFSDLNLAIMSINGGSAGPLWGMMAYGISETLDASSRDTNPAVLRLILAGALEGLHSVSNAKPGDKTMLDPLVKSVAAIQNTQDDELEIMMVAAAAAKIGAEQTKDMIAKFGRAKNLHENSLGHLDAGAVSVATAISAFYDEMRKLA